MILETLAEFTTGPAGQLPARVVDATIDSFIDTVGVMIQGSLSPVGQIAADYARFGGTGGSLLAAGGTTSAALAALANATAAHAEDFDDATTEVLSGHVSAVLVPVALAIGANGSELVEAFARGYEVEIALARGVNPYHYEVGYHPTATLGTFGAAASAARLLGLTTTQTANALAVAASFASGIKANFGTMTKPLHCGWAAHAGVVAASLALRGQQGNPAAYEAKQGFGPIYGGPGWRTDAVVDGLGTVWSLEDPGVTLRKVWPCCGSLLTTIEAVQQILADNAIDDGEIVAVRCGVHERRLPHTDRPNARTGDEGRFSLQYAAAGSLLGRAMTEADFTDAAVSDPAVQALMARTSATGDPRQTARTDSMNGEDFGAVVSVSLADGRTLESTVDYPKGSRTRPLSSDDLAEKFLRCAAARLGDVRAAQVLDALRTLPDLTDGRDIDFDPLEETVRV